MPVVFLNSWAFVKIHTNEKGCRGYKTGAAFFFRYNTLQCCISAVTPVHIRLSFWLTVTVTGFLPVAANRIQAGAACLIRFMLHLPPALQHGNYIPSLRIYIRRLRIYILRLRI